MSISPAAHTPYLHRRVIRAIFVFLVSIVVFSASASQAETPPQTAPATQADAPAQTDTEPFLSILQKAQKRAARSFKVEEARVPDFLWSLTEAQWKGIQFNPAHSLWRKKPLLFDLELFHPGFIYNNSVIINVIDKDSHTALPFSPDLFTYTNKALAGKVTQTPPGFAGFRITYPLNSPHSREGILSFLGASYFNSTGKYARKGVHARGLALNTALSTGEEIPFFREFWIVTPKPSDTSLTVYAMLDAPSLTGVYRYIITPGTSTVMDVDARLFLRKDATWPQKIGIAPLTSMFLFSETDNGKPGDYRPEVHNSDGLLLFKGDNAWSWVPLVNPSRLAVNTFQMENPRGFGLMQRDATFDHYQDIGNRFDRKSSVWVEPQGDWGTGRIELIQIPSADEIHDNITTFWVPDSLAPNAETTPPQSISLAYKLYWMTAGVTPHTLGRATNTRVIRNADTARFFIDFESEALKNLPEEFGLTSLVETPETAPITDKQLMKNPATGGWRLVFTVKLPRQDSVMQSIISAREGSARLRFRAVLKRGENLPDPLTEEWIYDLPL